MMHHLRPKSIACEGWPEWLDLRYALDRSPIRTRDNLYYRIVIFGSYGWSQVSEIYSLGIGSKGYAFGIFLFI